MEKEKGEESTTFFQDCPHLRTHPHRGRILIFVRRKNFVSFSLGGVDVVCFILFPIFNKRLVYWRITHFLFQFILVYSDLQRNIISIDDSVMISVFVSSFTRRALSLGRMKKNVNLGYSCGKDKKRGEKIHILLLNFSKGWNGGDVTSSSR